MNWSYPMMKLTSNTIILEGRVPMTLERVMNFAGARASCG